MSNSTAPIVNEPTTATEEDTTTTGKKHIRFDDQRSPNKNWKVYGTIQNSQNYDQPIFIENIFDV